MVIQVMVVDDSAVVRGLMTKALEQDPLFRVIATANDGQMAVDLAGRHLPDVIILDVEMPHMDGLTALPHLLRVAPKTKIIMVSGVEENLARVAVRALEQGAAEYMVKPMATGAQIQIQFYRELREKMKGLLPDAVAESRPTAPAVAEKIVPDDVPASGAKASQTVPPSLRATVASSSETQRSGLSALASKLRGASSPEKQAPSLVTPPPSLRGVTERAPSAPPPSAPPLSAPKSSAALQSSVRAPRSATGAAAPALVSSASPPPASLPAKRESETAPSGPFSMNSVRAIAIAASTGGPQALKILFDGLAHRVPDVPIFITQHMPASFTAVLADHIARASGAPCSEGVDGALVRAGSIYLAPGGYHMTARRQGDQVYIRTDQSPPVNFCRPAADPMFRALSEIYGDGLLGIVLTGMGQDAMEGGKILVKRGGTLIAQDEASSVVYGMPRAVAELGICHAVLPLGDISAFLLRR